jgi:CheY-like chemotaxis protein
VQTATALDILLVDDDRPLREMLTRSFEREGHRVTAVPDGEAAFDAAAERARTAEDQRVFLADAHALPPNVIDNLRWLVPLALDRDVAIPVRVRSAAPEGSGLTEPPPV